MGRCLVRGVVSKRRKIIGELDLALAVVLLHLQALKNCDSDTTLIFAGRPKCKKALSGRKKGLQLVVLKGGKDPHEFDD